MNNNKNKISYNIYISLKHKILNGEIKHNERLNESKIASYYGINKIHVKDALKDLTSENLAKHIPMKGFYAIGINNDDLIEIAKIRQLLEVVLIEEFIKTASDEEIKKAQQFMLRKVAFVKSNLIPDATIENKKCFELIYNHSKYTRIPNILNGYEDYIEVIIGKSFDTPESRKSTEKNSTLFYEALGKRDISIVKKWADIRHENLIKKILEQ